MARGTPNQGGPFQGYVPCEPPSRGHVDTRSGFEAPIAYGARCEDRTRHLVVANIYLPVRAVVASSAQPANTQSSADRGSIRSLTSSWTFRGQHSVSCEPADRLRSGGSDWGRKCRKLMVRPPCRAPPSTVSLNAIRDVCSDCVNRSPRATRETCR